MKLKMTSRRWMSAILSAMMLATSMPHGGIAMASEVEAAETAQILMVEPTLEAPDSEPTQIAEIYDDTSSVEADIAAVSSETLQPLETDDVPASEEPTSPTEESPAPVEATNAPTAIPTEEPIHLELSKKIVSFEACNPICEIVLDAGDAPKTLELPDSMLAVIEPQEPIQRFTQLLPKKIGNYVAPEKVEELYDAEETVVYVLETEGNVQYRLYGEADGETGWFACNKEGTKLYGMIQKVSVKWDDSNVNWTTAGSYMVSAFVKGYTLSCNAPQAQVRICAPEIAEETPAATEEPIVEDECGCGAIADENGAIIHSKGCPMYEGCACYGEDDARLCTEECSCNCHKAAQEESYTLTDAATGVCIRFTSSNLPAGVLAENVILKVEVIDGDKLEQYREMLGADATVAMTAWDICLVDSATGEEFQPIGSVTLSTAASETENEVSVYRMDEVQATELEVEKDVGEYRFATEHFTPFILALGRASGLKAVYWSPGDTQYNLDNTVYVQGGDDSNNGATADTPVRSFARAKELAANDGTIYIMQMCMVEEDLEVDGEDKNLTISRWQGGGAVQPYSGMLFNIYSGTKLTLRNIKLDADSATQRQIQMASSTAILQISDNVTIGGWLYFETPGAKLVIEDEPQEEYYVQFADNYAFNGQTVIESAGDFHIVDYIDQFHLHVNISEENQGKYHWLLVPSANRQDIAIDAERRDLYPGVYLDGTDLGNDANDGISPERPVKTFQRACEVALNEYNGEGIIYISGQVTISADETWSLPTSTYPDCMISRYEGYKDCMIKISSGATLTLEDIVIDGNGIEVEATDNMIKVYGNLVMDSGSVVQDGMAQTISVYGVGVRIYTGGEMEMKGDSRVEGCYTDISSRTIGGGICNAGVLTMSENARVLKCYAYEEGACVYNMGTMSMSGSASIEEAVLGNTSASALYNSGTVTVTENAKIANNAGTGIKNSGTLNISGGEFYGNDDAVVLANISAVCEMTGGRIYGNTASGVQISKGTMKAKSGTIEDNGRGVIISDVNKSTANTDKSYLELDAGMTIRDGILLGLTLYPIRLTDLNGALSSGSAQDFDIYVQEAKDARKYAFYSGSIIVRPDGDSVTDASDYSAHFIPKDNYRAAGYLECVILASGVYLDGTNGSDSNSGMGPEEAVATWACAKAKLESNQGQPTFENIIYASGNTPVSGTENWNAEGAFSSEGIILERFQHYLETMVSASGTLTLGSGITVRGSSAAVIEDRARAVNANKEMINVSGKLIMRDNASACTAYSTCNGAAICVDTQGEVAMQDNASISDCDAGGVAWYGGGIYAMENTRVTMCDNARISNCRVSTKTGSKGGGIYSNGTVEISGNVVIATCFADSGSHIAIGKNGTLKLGTEDGSSTVTLHGGNSQGELSGGGCIYISGTGVMYEGTIVRNSYSINGAGGVTVADNGTFTMEGGEIYGHCNDSLYQAVCGGVYVTGNGTFIFNDGRIYNNSCNSYGAGVRVGKNATMTMNGGEISGNTILRDEKSRGYDGGGIYNDGTLTINNGEISGNTAIRHGGGIYNAAGATLTFGTETESTQSCSLLNNTSENNGGGIYNAGSMTLNRGTISGNSAKGIGNGIYIAADAADSTLGGHTVIEPQNEPIQNIFMEKPSGVLSLSHTIDDGIYYMLDTPNTFLNQIVVRPKGDALTDATSELDHFLCSERMRFQWGYKLEGEGVNIVVKDDQNLFIDGVNGDDSRSGLSPAEAVKTWERILELLGNGKDGGIIYVVGTVNVGDAGNGSEWTLQNYQSSTVKRYPDLDDAAMLIIPAGCDFTLSDILIDGGYSDSIGTESSKGMIYVYGTLTMGDGCIVQNGCIREQIYGSAVEVYNGGTLTMEHGSSIRTQNKLVKMNMDAHAYGCALTIYAGGTGTLESGSVIEDNLIDVLLNTGAEDSGKGGGAGIYCEGSVNIGGTVQRNTTQIGRPYGGGVHIANYGEGQLNGGKISDNTVASMVQAPNSTFMGGGGLYVMTEGKFTIQSGELCNNTILASYYQFDSPDYLAGGGIHNEGTLTINGGKIYGNSAPLTTSTASGANSSNINAKVLYGINVYTSGNFSMNGGEIYENTYSTSIHWESRGGGLCVGGGTAVIKGGEIRNNAAKKGGGIYQCNGSSLDIQKCVIQGNAIMNSSGADGGGIFITDTNSKLTIGGESVEDVLISKNSGSGIFVEYSQNVQINKATISENTDGNGSSTGGIRVHYLGLPKVTITGALIEKNSGTFSAIYVELNGTVIINEGTVIRENICTTATVDVRSGTLIMNGGEICNNTASTQASYQAISTPGVLVAQSKGTFIMNGGSICYNGIPDGMTCKAGGVCVEMQAQFTMNGGSIDHNTAAGGLQNISVAGGVYCRGSMTMTGGEICSNMAKTDGNDQGQRRYLTGGIAINSSFYAGVVSLQGGSVCHNQANGSRQNVSNGGYDIFCTGGVFIDTSSVNNSLSAEIDGTDILNNSASASGEGSVLACAVGGLTVYGVASVKSGRICGNVGAAKAGSNAKPYTIREGSEYKTVVTQTDVGNAVGGIYVGHGSRLNLVDATVSGNGSQTVDVTDYNGGYLKNGIFVGGENALYMNGTADVQDNIYLSMVGRVVILNGSPASANRFKIAVAPDFRAGDVIVSPDGEQVNLAGVYAAQFSNANQRYAVTDGDEYRDIILANIIFLASYGSDANDGTTPDVPVATFKRAFELMDYPKHDRIYICGKVYIGNAGLSVDEQGRTLSYGDSVQSWALPSTTSILRYNGFSILGRSYDAYLGDLIEVCDGATLNLSTGDSAIGTDGFNTLNISGGNVSGTTGSMAYVVPGGTLNIDKGANMTGNVTSADGAVVRNYGTTRIKGGVFTGNSTTGQGGFVYQHGTLEVEGSITTNGDVYLASNPADLGYYINVSDTFTPNAGGSGQIEVNLAMSDAYIYRKIAVYAETLPEPDDAEKAKYDLPNKIMAIYELHNNDYDGQILELYRDMSLKVSKKVEGLSAGDPGYNTEFSFHVHFSEEGGEALYGPISYQIYDSDGNAVYSQAQSMTLNSGTGSFKLRDGWSIEFIELPTNTRYQVEEEWCDGFLTQYDANASGVITEIRRNDDGTPIENSGNEAPYTLITNIGTADFDFYKRNIYDQPLQGVQFKWYYCSNAAHTQDEDHGEPNEEGSCWHEFCTVMSDADGRVTLPYIPNMTFRLEETRTLDGYQIAIGYWLLRFGTDGTPQINSVDTFSPLEWKDGEGKYVIYNYPLVPLPLTGGRGRYAYASVGLMMCLAAIATAHVKRRRSRRHAA